MDEIFQPVRYSATGAVAPGGPMTVGYVILTAGSASATVDVREGGSGGTIVLTLAAPTGQSVGHWTAMKIQDPHVTLAGTGATVSLGI